jgi:hypothetical protein
MWNPWSYREARLAEKIGKRIIKLAVLPEWKVRQDMGDKTSNNYKIMFWK